MQLKLSVWRTNGRPKTLIKCDMGEVPPSNVTPITIYLFTFFNFVEFYISVIYRFALKESSDGNIKKSIFTSSVSQ